MSLVTETYSSFRVRLNDAHCLLSESSPSRDHASEGELEFVVDVEDLLTIKTEELNELIRLDAKARRVGRTLVLENVQQPLLQVFMVTRLDRLFNIRNPVSQSIG